MGIKTYKSFGWRGFNRAGMMQISERRRKSRTSTLSKLFGGNVTLSRQDAKQVFWLSPLSPQLGRNLACNWHPRDAQPNARIALQIVRGGVIKQMRVDVGLLRAPSAGPKLASAS